LLYASFFFVSIVVYGRQRSAATDVVTAISLWPATYLSAIIVVIRERQTAAHLLDSGSGDRESRQYYSDRMLTAVFCLVSAYLLNCRHRFCGVIVERCCARVGAPYMILSKFAENSSHDAVMSLTAECLSVSLY